VKQEDDDSKPFGIDLKDSSEVESSANKLNDMEEEDDREGKDELPGMP